MQYITEWITNIILIILLATILELLLPNSSFQRYVKMVVGLMLIVVILNPLLSIFSKNPDVIFKSIHSQEKISNEEVENLIESKKREIEMGQRAYISEQVAVQMKRQVEEELVDNYGVEVEEVLISIDEFASKEDILKSITAVSVTVKQRDHVQEQLVESEVVPVVTIDVSSEQPKKPTNEQSVDLIPIQHYLASEWQISKDVISLALEGGDK